MTAKQSWYQRNREKAIQNAREWRLAHPERYREVQRAAKRRKREALRPKMTLEAVQRFVHAPGFDPRLHGDYALW